MGHKLWWNECARPSRTTGYVLDGFTEEEEEEEELKKEEEEEEEEKEERSLRR